MAVSIILCKRFSELSSSSFTAQAETAVGCPAWKRPVQAGDTQGGGSPLVGGAGCRMRASAFGWRAACAGVGEPARPGFPPEGETGKGALKNASLLPQAEFAYSGSFVLLQTSGFGQLESDLPQDFEMVEHRPNLLLRNRQRVPVGGKGFPLVSLGVLFF